MMDSARDFDLLGDHDQSAIRSSHVQRHVSDVDEICTTIYTSVVSFCT